MDLLEHACELGKLLGNLQSLELGLRSFLYHQQDPPHSPAAQGSSLLAPLVGDEVPENAFTDWSSLGQLVDRFNARVSVSDPTLVVDRSVVDLRDMLVHGRLSASSAAPPLRLVKFDKPVKGRARVTFSAEITLDWLKSSVTRVRHEIEIVQRASADQAP